MNFSNKKAQAALEYLQTYGWAILVIIVIGFAIWKLGILGPHRGTNTASGFTAIRVLEPSIRYSGDYLNFTVMNAKGTRVKITDTYGSGDCSVVWLTLVSQAEWGDEVECLNHGGVWKWNLCWRYDPISLDPGEKTGVKIAVCDELRYGEQFEVYVTINYKTRVGGNWVKYTDRGVIRGYAE